MDTGRFGSPTSGVSCRRSASELCVRGGHGWFRSTASRVSDALLSQLSYTTMGPAPGLEPGSTGLQSQCPSSLGPAGTSSAAVVTPRRRERRPHRTSRTRRAGPAPTSPVSSRGSRARSTDVGSSSIVGYELAVVVVASVCLLSGRSGGRCRTLVSRTKTLRPAVGRLPSGWLLEGSMGTAPITRGWKPRVYLSTP